MYTQSGENLAQRLEIDRFGDARIATRILTLLASLKDASPVTATIGMCARCLCLRAQ